MEVLVSYDVATDTAEGRRRLRRFANVCEGYGQRVQKSVFECKLSDGDFARLERRLLAILDQKADSLRIYFLREPRRDHLRVHGRDVLHDIHEPLVV